MAASARAAPCSPSLSDGLFAGGGLGNDPDAAAPAGAHASAAPGAEAAAPAVAERPTEASAPAAEAAAAAAHAVAAAAVAAAAVAATVAAAAATHAQGGAAAVAHPAGGADHGCRDTTPASGPASSPSRGDLLAAGWAKWPQKGPFQPKLLYGLHRHPCGEGERAGWNRGDTYRHSRLRLPLQRACRERGT